MNEGDKGDGDGFPQEEAAEDASASLDLWIYPFHMLLHIF